MKALKSVKKLSKIVGLFIITAIYSSLSAQEYDDMYFNKSDRKTAKVEKATLIPNSNKSSAYKEITKSTETFSAKNVNPEYIARYKSAESNQVIEEVNQKNDGYNSSDYFVEGYDKSAYISDSKKGEIDYVALNKRDQMSAKSNNNSFSNSAMRFSPYMAMGFGSAYGRYGYDPFMMPGYGMGMGMGMGFGSGFGYSPFTSFNIGMSWGTGYNPWGNFHNPYRMRGYDPWRSMYGYNPYNSFGNSPYFGGGFGGYCPTFITNSYSNKLASEYNNGRNIQYKPRTATRVRSTNSGVRSNNENLRTSSSNSNIRVPNRTTSSTASNGRISRDYSKGQNEYYNKARRSSSSARRISSSNSTRNTYSRNSNSVSRNKSSISNNKPSRVSNYSSGYSRNNSSSKSYSSPSRSSSSSFSGRSTSGGGSSFGSSNSSATRSSSGSRSTSSSSPSRSSRR